MKKTLHYIAPYKTTVVWGLIIKFVGAMSELVLPMVLDYLIDDVAPTGSVSKVVVYGLIMLFFAALCVVCNIWANKLSADSSGSMTHDLRLSLFSKTTALQSKQVDGVTMPSLISRLTSDTYYVNQTVAQTLRMGVRAPILLIGGLIFCFFIDPFLALVLLACVPIVTIGFVFITKKSVKVYNDVQKGGDRMVRSMQENITGVRVIKALSKSDYEIQKFKGVNDSLTDMEYKANKITSLTNPFATLLLNLGLVGIIVVGALKGSSSGDLLAFLSYFTIILNAVLGLSKIFVNISRGTASATRIEKVLDLDETVKVYDDLPEGDKSAKIEFKDVTFSYNSNVPNLEGISFKALPGQTIGVIGGTGSGKSTIINLLMRFYDCDEGAIYIDGKDVRSYPICSLRAKFGVAFQNDFLYSGTIKDNIKYFRDISDENIQKAADVAQATEFIQNLEGGMDYIISQKASNLSGGQKQRVLIARALASDPEILVLDDSSSALDYVTDANLRRDIAKKYPRCTKFLVAQRVSAIKHADIILVLDDGKVVGVGKHDELVTSCDEYREIYFAQMGEEI